MPKVNRSGKSSTLTPQQQELLKKNLNRKMALLADVMWYSAGRVSEVAALRARNINFHESTLVFEKSYTKTKQTRDVPIPHHLCKELKKWIEENLIPMDGFIFFSQSSPQGKTMPGEKPITRQAVDKAFRHAFDYIGISGASLHYARRSYLTHLHQSGLSLRECQEVSRHSSLSSLQQYLDADRQAVFSKVRALFPIQ